MALRLAERDGARVLISIEGISGSGKTYTALQIAYGLAGGDSKKVGLLDTENRRGSLYADILKDKDGNIQKFWIDDLYAPFTPERYIQKIQEFQASGVRVLVIDSASHEWNGIGGILAEVEKIPKKIHAWRKWKPEHRRFVDTLLQCDMDIIVCLRSTNKTDWSDPSKPKSLGIMPIQQEEFIFETTVSIEMHSNGKERLVKKCPEALAGIFGEAFNWHQGYIGAKEGYKLKQWISGGGQVDQVLEKALNILRSNAQNGTRGLKAAFDSMSEELKAKVGNQIPAEILQSAQAFDELSKTPVSDINEQIKGQENG